MQRINLKQVIKHIIFMGDSLSDRDTFAQRKILYSIIPNNAIVDLSKSPHGRFTNGYTWDDYLCEMLVSRFLAKDIEKKVNMDAEDIADAVITKDPKVEDLVQGEDTLEHDTHVESEGERFARSYCEGGLSAHDYHNSLTWRPYVLFARRIVATLDQKRALLLNDDKKLAVGDEEKKHTLIIEWSGANDLLTVNAEPTNEEADMAIAARMENIKELYKNGYRNFVLFDLPDVSLTPRFQSSSMSERDRKNASDVCQYFNKRLKDECEKLKKSMPELLLDVFDINRIITNIYLHPGDYGFKKEHLTTAFTASKDYKMEANHTSHADGYLFWDDIHPTATAHHKMAVAIDRELEHKFTFTAPEQTAKTDAKRMFETFMEKYKAKYKSDTESIYSLYGRTTYAELERKLHTSHLGLEDNADYIHALAIILKHGLNESGARTRGILLELEWIDPKYNIDKSNPALAAAQRVMARETTGLERTNK